MIFYYLSADSSEHSNKLAPLSIFLIFYKPRNEFMSMIIINLQNFPKNLGGNINFLEFLDPF